jgi:hypothetical protein
MTETEPKLRTDPLKLLTGKEKCDQTGPALFGDPPPEEGDDRFHLLRAERVR